MGITQDDTVCCFAHARYTKRFFVLRKRRTKLDYIDTLLIQVSELTKKKERLSENKLIEKLSYILTDMYTHVMIWFHLKGILLTSSIYLYKGHLYSKEHIKKTVDSKHQNVPKTSF